MKTPMVVVSRSSDGDLERRSFEDALINTLSDAAAELLVVPSLYFLPDAHPGLAALRGVTGDVVYASWLYPRASLWLLHARGVAVEGAGHTIRTFNLAAFDSPGACAAELLGAAPPQKTSDGRPPREIQGDPEPRWYPVLDVSACVACGQCYDFCLFGVYSLSQDGRPEVTAPDKCKPGCPACARICPKGAIIFPLCAADEGIAGAPGKHPARMELDADAFFDGPAKPPAGGDAPDDLDELIDALDDLDV